MSYMTEFMRIGNMTCESVMRWWFEVRGAGRGGGDAWGGRAAGLVPVRRPAPEGGGLRASAGRRFVGLLFGASGGRALCWVPGDSPVFP